MPERWMSILDAVDGDPLAAQEIDRKLNQYPAEWIAALLAAARGNPKRALKIARGVNAKWWMRWSEYVKMRYRIENGEGNEF